MNGNEIGEVVWNFETIGSLLAVLLWLTSLIATIIGVLQHETGKVEKPRFRRLSPRMESLEAKSGGFLPTTWKV